MRISDWSSDVCSSDLLPHPGAGNHHRWRAVAAAGAVRLVRAAGAAVGGRAAVHLHRYVRVGAGAAPPLRRSRTSAAPARSEEHTSELQSLMRISYAVFCLKTKTKII